MAYQKVTSTSYGSRLKNAVGGVFTGFLMLIAGIVLLFWNEGRTVKTTRMLKESQSVCVELGDIASVNPDMSGKMVHATGLATTDEVLTDSFFGVSAPAIKLFRNVEYYQWIEHTKRETRDKIGGGQETITTYTYSRDWVSKPTNSAEFEDPAYRGIANDVLLQIENESLQARDVHFGAYRFPEGLVSQMNDRRDLIPELDPAVTADLEKQLQRGAKTAVKDSMVHVLNNTIYIGANPNRPAVGDLRVRFQKVLPGEVSILAKINGDTFESFTAKNGYTLLTLRDGSVSMENMYEGAHKGNRMLAWVLRFLGILLLYLGFRNIFDILTAILKVLPFLGNIAGLGIGLVSIILALAVGLIVIAIAWIVYRPVLGILLLIAACALIWYLGKKSKEKAAEMPPAETEA